MAPPLLAILCVWPKSQSPPQSSSLKSLNIEAHSTARKMTNGQSNPLNFRLKNSGDIPLIRVNTNSLKRPVLLGRRGCGCMNNSLPGVVQKKFFSCPRAPHALLPNDIFTVQNFLDQCNVAFDKRQSCSKNYLCWGFA